MFYKRDRRGQKETRTKGLVAINYFKLYHHRVKKKQALLSFRAREKIYFKIILNINAPLRGHSSSVVT